MTPEEQRRLAELRPEVLLAYQAYRADCLAQGIKLCAIKVYRSPEVQAAKKAAGLSDNTLGWHQIRRAIDEQIYDPAALAWDHKAKREDLYLRRARIAEQHGFRQLGFWPDGSKRMINKGKTWDPFHIEFRAPHKTLAEALQAEFDPDERMV